MNLPKTFEPIAYTGEVENAARAAGWTVLPLMLHAFSRVSMSGAKFAFPENSLSLVARARGLKIAM